MKLNNEPSCGATKASRLRALKAQIRRLERRLARLQSLSYRLSWIRLAVFVAGLLATGLVSYFVGTWPAGLCAGAAALLFGVTAYYHRQIDKGIARHQIWRGIKAGQIARASLDWEHIPATFLHQPSPAHPFEADLGLAGGRSLHQLLNTAVSYEGSQRLRDWLTAAIPDPEQIRARQRLVSELLPLHLFRDKLTLHATLAAGEDKAWRASDLVEWLDRPASGAHHGRWLLLLGALAAVDAVLFIASQLALLPSWWQFTFVLYLGLTLARSRSGGTAWDEAMRLQGALRQLRAVFRQLESFPYRNTPHLRRLCEPFLDPAHRPSTYLTRITRVVVALGLRGNLFVYFALNAVVPWDLFFAYRLNRCQGEIAKQARIWLDAWFDLEAASSLATFAYLNPHYAFPELAANAGQTPDFVFRAEGLGHPLIPDDKRICSDFSVAEPGQVTIVSGSNMAGKSVFLKTIAVNLVLANAGGVVSARRLQTVVFRVFTAMAISDSVTDGVSYFYAEVKRLRALLGELEGEHPLPLLYCIDEIFRGTNNRERLIGARAYVRALAGRDGVGFIATHDLELAKLADEVPQVKNYHFRDNVVGDRMVFDYVLHPGPCPTTNALRIMRLQGLPVPATDDAGS